MSNSSSFPNDSSNSDFAKLFEESISKVQRKLEVGDRIEGEILSINKDEIFVSTGTMHDGMVQKLDLLSEDGSFNYKKGDVLKLYVISARGSEIRLSPKPTAKNISEDLEDAFDMMLPVEGVVKEITNGGFRVSIHNKLAFCPISQIDSKRIEDSAAYVGRKLEFLITAFEKGGKNIVVSRRRLLDQTRQEEESTFLSDKKAGDVLNGTITRLEKFGAFVDLGSGLEALCHISELSWSRVENPSEVVSVGQKVKCKILSIEDQGNRLKISVSIKQVESEPWTQGSGGIKVGETYDVKITRLMKFGAFAEIFPGIEGLIPLGEMDAERRINKPEEVVKVGDRVKAQIREMDLAARRISLSMKDAAADPSWAQYAGKSASKGAGLGGLADQLQKALAKK